MVDSREYQNHPIFEDLDYFVEFYEHLAHQTFRFLARGTRAVFSMDSYVFSSIQGTLDSIRMLLRAGMMNDAYALLRKYHDSAVINAYTSLYVENHFSLEEFIVERIEGWRSGLVKLPSFKTMLAYLQQSDSLESLNKVLAMDDRYLLLRKRCNGHVHYNYYAHMALNIKEIYLDGRVGVLTQMRSDLRDVLVLHLAYVFTINYAYMGSSDYIDALECGLEPEEGSQNWVSRLVQELFDNFITPWRPDVTTVIQANSLMELA